MIRLERALVWTFAAWCLWTVGGQALELVRILRIDTPLLPSEATRTTAWVTAEVLAAFSAGLALAAVRLSEWGRAPRWRWIAGTYAVLLVALHMAGWV